jgi:SAM-dependent methyltransferase
VGDRHDTIAAGTLAVGMSCVVQSPSLMKMIYDWSTLVTHYEQCLERHGATAKGVDWPNVPDLAVRFHTLLSLLDGEAREPRPVLLDLGCGSGLLLDYLRATGRLRMVQYRGIDLSPAMVATARARWPEYDFSCRDVLNNPLPEQSVDYVIMNGVLTEKQTLSHEVMAGMAKELIVAAFSAARVGIAFNAMSHHVDWQRPELFHWGFDELSAFLRERVSPHYAFRSDYGLYEHTTFVWRTARRPPSLAHDWCTA